MVTKTVERLKKPSDMTPEEFALFEKRGPSDKALYLARLAAQDAQDAVAAAKVNQEKAREGAKRARSLASGERKLTAAVRGGEIPLTDALAKIKAFGLSETGATVYTSDGLNPPPKSLEVTDEEAAEMFARIEEAAKKPTSGVGSRSGGGASKIVAPTFKLAHTLVMLAKSAFLAPTDGGRPDVTLASLVRRFGFVSPFLVTHAPEGGFYQILDGKRRYYLMNDTELVPAVIVAGFPDEYTQEAAEIALNRGRTLNVLRAGEVIAHSRTRGKSDAELRRDMGFKTGEVDKYAKAASLPAPLAEALKGGRMTPATALLLAKSPATVVEAVTTAYLERKGKETAENPARISEADVDTARGAASKAAITRDAPTLLGLTGGVSQEDATGGANGAADSQGVSPAPQAPGGVSDAGTGVQEKTLDGGAGAGVSSATWVEGALGELEKIRTAIPQDAPEEVLSLYRELVGLVVDAGGGIEYANTPDANPPVMFKAPKKAEVENTVAARPGWKASVMSKFKGFNERVDVSATSVLAAAQKLHEAVKAATTGASE